MRRRLLVTLADFFLLPLGVRSTLTSTNLPGPASRPLARFSRRRFRRLRRLPIACPSLSLCLPIAHDARVVPIAGGDHRPLRRHDSEALDQHADQSRRSGVPAAHLLTACSPRSSLLRAFNGENGPKCARPTHETLRIPATLFTYLACSVPGGGIPTQITSGVTRPGPPRESRGTH